MITFSDEQIAGFTAEEKEMLNNLAERHFVRVPDTDEEEKKRAEEEQKRVKERIAKLQQKTKENEEYAKWMESQFDNNGHSTVTQYF